MGLTSAGLDLAAYALVSGNKLALGTNSITPLTPGYRNYQDVTITWSTTPTGEETAHLSSSGGVLKNYNRFYFNDADDATGGSSTGWGTVTHVMVVTGDSDRTVLYSGALTGGGVSVPQNTRPKFEAGAFQLTFTS